MLQMCYRAVFDMFSRTVTDLDCHVPHDDDASMHILPFPCGTLAACVLADKREKDKQIVLKSSSNGSPGKKKQPKTKAPF